MLIINKRFTEDDFFYFYGKIMRGRKQQAEPADQRPRETRECEISTGNT